MTKEAILDPLIVHYSLTTRAKQRFLDLMDQYAKQESEKAFNAARMQAGFMALTPGSHIETGYKHDTFEDYYSKNRNQ